MVLPIFCVLGIWTRAADPFAIAVVAYDPAPGQFVNVSVFNDPTRALGPPSGGGTAFADNSSLVTLGGFGGSITLAFEHTVKDDPLNPFGLDAVVFGNAVWVGGDPTRQWAEPATIEISADVNGNGLPDDPWYLIPGSHIPNPTQAWVEVFWDDDTLDETFPPQDEGWIPQGRTGVWATGAYALPVDVFGPPVVSNPNNDPGIEGIYGYAEFSPTLVLGDLDADNVVDDPTILPSEFYTIPDDPFTVGMTPGSGGGDAFDIAWAIDPATGEPAKLAGFDFIRLTTAVNIVDKATGTNEKSPEIDAVADVAPDPFGDMDVDGDIDLLDAAELLTCFDFAVTPLDVCARADRQPDGTISEEDVPAFVRRMTGPLERNP